MILQLILWLATAIHAGSHITGCLTDVWQHHAVVMHISAHHGVVTTPLIHGRGCR